MKPEEKVRQKIDHLLSEAGWEVQDRTELNLSAGVGVAVREYLTEVGPADYILFVDRKPVGVIEAKKEEEGVRLTVVEPAAKLLERIKAEKAAQTPIKKRGKSEKGNLLPRPIILTKGMV